MCFTGDPDDADDKGVCLYLDGMSGALHGDPATAARDREIRSWLRSHGYQVIEITYVELNDAEDGTWHHETITLSPLNPDFEPIHLSSDDDRSDVVAELVEVLG